MKLWHFYHVYARENASNVWIPIVTEHVNFLRFSELGQKFNKTYIGVVGNKVDAEKILTIFTDGGIKCELCAIDDLGWEQLTLNKLYEFSLQNSGYVLYAHTKGAAHQDQTRNTHRRVMNEHLIGKWAEHIDLLSKGFCATGVLFLRGSPEEPFIYSANKVEKSEHNHCIRRYCGFFAGNFWWCNLDFVKTMGRPSMENRIKAEAWMNNLYHSISKDKYMIYDMLPVNSIAQYGLDTIFT